MDFQKVLDSDIVNIARMAWGSGFFEGTDGGVGQMGIIRGNDGEYRVIKFNTHRSEQGRPITAESLKASNELRAELLKIATYKGLSNEKIAEIRKELGLAIDGNETQAQELLDRTIVAKVVKLIDANIWDKALKESDGQTKFNMAQYKSDKASLGTSFEQISISERLNQKLGISSNPQILDEQIELKEWKEKISSMVEKCKNNIDSGTKVRTNPRAWDAFERLLKVATEKRIAMGKNFLGGNKAEGKESRNIVFTTLARTLVAFGQDDVARIYLKLNMQKNEGPDNIENVFVSAGLDVLGETLRNCEHTQGKSEEEVAFIKEEVLMGMIDKSYRENGPAYSLNDAKIDKEDLRELASKAAGHLGDMPKMSEDEMAAMDSRITKWSANEAKIQENKRQIREAADGFLKELDSLNDGVLPELFKTILSENVAMQDINTIKTWTKALELAKNSGITDNDRAAIKQLNLGKKEEMVLQHFREMQLAQFFEGEVNCKIGDFIDYFAKNEIPRSILNQSIDLTNDNEEKIKSDIKDFIGSTYNKIDDEVDVQNGIFAESLREYIRGTIEINGEIPPKKPIDPDKVIKIHSGHSGTEGEEKLALIEHFTKQIPDTKQRRLAMILTSMANGIEGYLQSKVFSKSKGGVRLNNAPTTNEVLSATNNKTNLIPGNCEKHFSISTNADGSIKFNCKVGVKIAPLTINGTNLTIAGKQLALTEFMCEFDLTISKPNPNDASMPAITITSIRNL